MPFVSPIDRDPDFAEFLYSDHLGHGLMLPLGYEWKAERSWSLFIDLRPIGIGLHELTFWLAGRDDDDENRDYLDGRDVAALIGREDRAAIRQVLVKGARWLISRARPRRLLLCSTTPLAPRALKKFLVIAQAIGEAGYEVSPPMVWKGRHSWWAERIDDDDSAGYGDGKRF